MTILLSIIILASLVYHLFQWQIKRELRREINLLKQKVESLQGWLMGNGK